MLHVVVTDADALMSLTILSIARVILRSLTGPRSCRCAAGPDIACRGERRRREGGGHHQAATSVRDSQLELFDAGTSL